MKHIFMLSILFKSHLIIHSSTGRAFKDTQRALGRHSGTRAPKALGHLGTWGTLFSRLRFLFNSFYYVSIVCIDATLDGLFLPTKGNFVFTILLWSFRFAELWILSFQKLIKKWAGWLSKNKKKLHLIPILCLKFST